MKEFDVKTYNNKFRETMPDYFAVYIDERDKIMAWKLRNIARGRINPPLGSNPFPSYNERQLLFKV